MFKTYPRNRAFSFIDNANEMTNASIRQQVVAPTPAVNSRSLLIPSAILLPSIFQTCLIQKQTVDWEKLRRTIRTSIRMQDNVIDKTTYFLEENRVQPWANEGLAWESWGSMISSFTATCVTEAKKQMNSSINYSIHSLHGL